MPVSPHRLHVERGDRLSFLFTVVSPTLHTMPGTNPKLDSHVQKEGRMVGGQAFLSL